jgi:hypothetical protein
MVSPPISPPTRPQLVDDAGRARVVAAEVEDIGLVLEGAGDETVGVVETVGLEGAVVVGKVGVVEVGAGAVDDEGVEVELAAPEGVGGIVRVTVGEPGVVMVAVVVPVAVAAGVAGEGAVVVNTVGENVGT